MIHPFAPWISCLCISLVPGQLVGTDILFSTSQEWSSTFLFKELGEKREGIKKQELQD